jgi:hypothetical protein
MSDADNAVHTAGSEGMAVSPPTARWRLRRGESGLRLGQVRAFGTDRFTWADLLQAPLTATQVYALYFPSRFDLPVDAAVAASLRLFGDQTSARTSVDFWDPKDAHFSEALRLFGLRNPPALVLATGLGQQAAEGGEAAKPEGSLSAKPEGSLYCVCFADQAVLADRERLATAVNITHEILIRCDRLELAGYIRRRKIKALLAAIGHGAGAVRDELVKLHPTFGLPGGLSLELG